MSYEGYSFFLLRAVSPTPQQLVQLLTPTNGRYPETEAEFEALQTQLRRIGHIVENAPNNLGHYLRAQRHAAGTFFMNPWDGTNWDPQQDPNADQTATAYVAQDGTAQQPVWQQGAADPWSTGADPWSGGGTAAPPAPGAAFLAADQEEDDDASGASGATGKGWFKSAKKWFKTAVDIGKTASKVVKGPIGQHLREGELLDAGVEAAKLVGDSIMHLCRLVPARNLMGLQHAQPRVRAAEGPPLGAVARPNLDGFRDVHRRVRRQVQGAHVAGGAVHSQLAQEPRHPSRECKGRHSRAARERGGGGERGETGRRAIRSRERSSARASRWIATAASAKGTGS